MEYNNAFDEIMNTYYKKIFNYCYKQLKNENNAMDCTQEVFFIFYKKQNKLSYTENIKNWLYKVADIEIKKFRRLNVQYNELDDNLSTDPFDTLKEIPIKSLLQLEEYTILDDFYIQGKSISDISKEFGITISSAYKKIYRAKQKLIILLKSDKKE